MNVKLKIRLASTLCVVVGVAGMDPASAAGGDLPLWYPPCGSDIDKSFRLSADLACTGNGWRVIESGVTIDLNGHTLSGDGGGSDFGIFNAAGASDIRLRNGTVRRFGTGVLANLVFRITDVVAVLNTSDGIVFGQSTSGGAIRNSTAVANGGSGIELRGKATSATGNRVVRNGIGLLITGKRNLVEANTVLSNLGNGIWITGDRNLVTRGAVGDNGSASSNPGILVAGEENSVVRTKIFGNADDGYRDTGTSNRASRNRSFANGLLPQDESGTGIDASVATTPRGSKNISRGNDALDDCLPAKICTTSSKNPQQLPELTPPCGSKVTQSFILAEDLQCPDDGLIVGAPSITIDLGGHTLRGDGGIGDHGIINDPAVLGSGFDDVTIRNGVVRKFNKGVVVADNVARNVVSNIVFLWLSNSSIELLGPEGTAKNNTLASQGLRVSGPNVNVERNRLVRTGLTLLDDSALVRSNIIAGESSEGIFANTSDSRIEANVIAGNGHGLDAESGIETNTLNERNVYTGNALVGNAGAGLHDQGDDSEIVDNTAVANGFFQGVADGTGAGIIADASSTGSGNTALANDAIVQCDPAELCA